MAYETLNNSALLMPANKPNYTPAKTLKKALKTIRKFFKKSAAAQQQQFRQNEGLFAAVAVPSMESIYPSDEECDNFENERLEAALFAAIASGSSTAIY